MNRKFSELQESISASSNVRKNLIYLLLSDAALFGSHARVVWAIGLNLVKQDLERFQRQYYRGLQEIMEG